MPIRICGAQSQICRPGSLCGWLITCTTVASTFAYMKASETRKKRVALSPAAFVPLYYSCSPPRP